MYYSTNPICNDVICCIEQKERVKKIQKAFWRDVFNSVFEKHRIAQEKLEKEEMAS